MRIYIIKNRQIDERGLETKRRHCVRELSTLEVNKEIQTINWLNQPAFGGVMNWIRLSWTKRVDIF